MSDIRIQRDHALGLPAARQIAWRWAEQAESEFSMECEYEEGDTEDCVRFSRSGVSGELRVTGGRFDLHAKLGFLLGAFKERIESEIVKNLDTLLAGGGTAGAKTVSTSAAKTATKTATRSAARPARK